MELESAQKEGFHRTWLGKWITGKQSHIMLVALTRWLREPDANLSYQHLHFPDYVSIFYSLLMMLTFQFSLGKIFPIYEKD